MDLSNLDAGSIAGIVICGLVIVIAVVRFIIHFLSNRNDK